MSVSEWHAHENFAREMHFVMSSPKQNNDFYDEG